MTDEGAQRMQTDRNELSPQAARSAAEGHSVPPVAERAAWQAAIDELRVREKAHTHEGDAIAAARRRLPMTELDPGITVDGPSGSVPLLDVFEGRSQLIAYFHMWYAGKPAPEQCEGCTWFTSQVRELATVHSRDATYAILCQGPYDESVRYRDFMGWDVPWYSAEAAAEALFTDRASFLLACYLQHEGRVFETYWTTGRGVERMSTTYGVLDLTVHGRHEAWEDSPEGWPQPWSRNGENPFRSGSRPIPQWPRLAAGHSDDLT
jgi:predicted dithiol-disulfide oxidoreductase (DUF899 family)